MNAVGRWNEAKPTNLSWAEKEGNEMRKKRWSHSRRLSADSERIIFTCSKTFNLIVKCSKRNQFQFLLQQKQLICANKN